MKSIGLAVLIGLFGAVPAAHASPRQATVTTSHGHVEAMFTEYCESSGRDTECGGTASSGGLPEVVTTADDSVKIALDDDAQKLSGRLVGALGITPLRLDARTYSFPYPPGVLLPRTLRFTARYRSGYAKWAVMLVPPDMPRLSELRLHGRQLSIRLKCPSGCTGTLALSFDGPVLARLKFAGLTNRTLKHRVNRATQRLLNGYAELNARLATEGRAPFSTDVEFRP